MDSLFSIECRSPAGYSPPHRTTLIWIQIDVRVPSPMEQWMHELADKLTAEHGTVPPPWVVYNEHPYSICWRMGGGESHIMLWWEWWPLQNFTEDQKIEYFRRWPLPHCWLAFIIEAIWGIDPLEDEEKLPPCFERTSALGFGSQEDYQRDLDDPKWLEEDS